MICWINSIHHLIYVWLCSWLRINNFMKPKIKVGTGKRFSASNEIMIACQEASCHRWNWIEFNLILIHYPSSCSLTLSILAYVHRLYRLVYRVMPVIVWMMATDCIHASVHSNHCILSRYPFLHRTDYYQIL